MAAGAGFAAFGLAAGLAAFGFAAALGFAVVDFLVAAPPGDRFSMGSTAQSLRMRKAQASTVPAHVACSVCQHLVSQVVGLHTGDELRSTKLPCRPCAPVVFFGLVAVVLAAVFFAAGFFAAGFFAEAGLAVLVAAFLVDEVAFLAPCMRPHVSTLLCRAPVCSAGMSWLLAAGRWLLAILQACGPGLSGMLLVRAG